MPSTSWSYLHLRPQRAEALVDRSWLTGIKHHARFDLDIPLRDMKCGVNGEQSQQYFRATHVTADWTPIKSRKGVLMRWTTVWREASKEAEVAARVIPKSDCGEEHRSKASFRLIPAGVPEFLSEPCGNLPPDVGCP